MVRGHQVADVTRMTDSSAVRPGLDMDPQQAGGMSGKILHRHARRDPQLAQPMIEGLPYIWAEVPYAVEHEMAMTTIDILERRMHILNESRDMGMSIAPQVTARLGDFLDWDKTEIERELRAYQDRVAQASAFGK